MNNDQALIAAVTARIQNDDEFAEFLHELMIADNSQDDDGVDVASKIDAVNHVVLDVIPNKFRSLKSNVSEAAEAMKARSAEKKQARMERAAVRKLKRSAVKIQNLQRKALDVASQADRETMAASEIAQAHGMDLSDLIARIDDAIDSNHELLDSELREDATA